MNIQESIRRMLREIEEDRIQIRLGRSAERHFGTVQNIIIQVDNEDITGQDGEPGLGKMNIVIKDGEIIVGDIFIPEKYRRQGIATQVYQKISDHFGLPIVNSKTKGFNQTMEGGYMWKDREKFEPRNLQESIRRILREEVPPQVIRRIDDYDFTFEKYRKSFLPNKYRAFFVFWNLLMEVTMETIYHVWFKKTVSDEDWDDSSDYIVKYLTEKYKDETEQMWNEKNRNGLNESESKQERKFTKLLNNIQEYLNSNSYDSVVRFMVDYDEVMDDVIVNIFFDAEHAVKLGGGINRVIKSTGKKIMEDLSVFPFDFKYHIHFERPQLNESEDDKEKKIQKNLRAIRQLLDTIDVDGLCEMWVEYNPEDGDYEIRSKTTVRYYDMADMAQELGYIEDTIRSWKLKTYVFSPYYVENCEDEIEFMS